MSWLSYETKASLGCTALMVDVGGCVWGDSLGNTREPSLLQAAVGGLGAFQGDFRIPSPTPNPIAPMAGHHHDPMFNHFANCTYWRDPCRGRAAAAVFISPSGRQHTRSSHRSTTHRKQRASQGGPPDRPSPLPSRDETQQDTRRTTPSWPVHARCDAAQRSPLSRRTSGPLPQPSQPYGNAETLCVHRGTGMRTPMVMTPCLIEVRASE